jgi:hypothetical protein
VNADDKRQLLQDAMRTRSKLFDLEFVLQLKAKNATGDAATALAQQIADTKAKSDELSAQIDRLRAAAAQQWTGDATTLVQTLKADNTRIQDQIRAVEDAAQVGDQVTKILGLADGVIGLVTGLLA